MKDYAAFYQRLSRPARTSKLGLFLVKEGNRVITKGMYLAYPLLLCILVWRRGFLATLPFVVIPALSFLIVTIVRKKINRPRPYEEWDIEPLLAQKKQGESMPSRHVFSASMVSMCFLRFCLPLGLFCLFLTLLLAIRRVVGGVHYPKDVLVGLLLGILMGSFLYLF